MAKLTHLDETGRATMVDVGEKAVTERVAVARGRVVMQPETLQLIIDGNVKKGDVLTVAQLAGIMAAKRTSELVPLCHPIALTKVEVQCEPDADAVAIAITARVECVGKTGVEMEALTAVSIAALTVYDMAKAIDKRMVIDGVELVSKTKQ